MVSLEFLQKAEDQRNKCYALGIFTFKTNLAFSAVDRTIRNGIVGHATRLLAEDLYLYIADEKLVEAVHFMRFDYPTSLAPVGEFSKVTKECRKKSDQEEKAMLSHRLSGLCRKYGYVLSAIVDTPIDLIEATPGRTGVSAGHSVEGSDRPNDRHGGRSYKRSDPRGSITAASDPTRRNTPPYL